MRKEKNIRENDFLMFGFIVEIIKRKSNTIKNSLKFYIFFIFFVII